MNALVRTVLLSISLMPLATAVRGAPNATMRLRALKLSDASTRQISGDGPASGISFLALKSSYGLISTEGVAEIPCGFQAERLFLLGCTIAEGRPPEIGGWVEILYDDGAPDRIPLVIGGMIDIQGKLLSRSPAMRLHPTNDPFQFYLAIRPRRARIRAIRLARNTGATPRITAVTCQTDATCDTLLPLPAAKLDAAERAWLEKRTLSAQRLDLTALEAEIRKANKIEQAVVFQRRRISDRKFEAASTCDVNRDGVTDIVSGGFWYEGPAFTVSHKIRDVRTVSEYLDDFCDYPMDVNGDGYPDIISGAYFGNPMQWLENPKGKTSPWQAHDIAQVGPIETIRFWDVDGDGRMEVVPNAGGNVQFFRLTADSDGKGTGRFTKHVVKKGGCGHGLGFGDIDGDGRGDFITPDGWLEAPADPLHGEWTWHDDGLRLGLASVPILVHDVDKDGKADLIVGQAHGYGLDWYEQATGSFAKSKVF